MTSSRGMNELHVDISHAQALIRDLLAAASRTDCEAPPALSSTPGMERFAEALARAGEASAGRSRQLVEFTASRAERSAAEIRHIMRDDVSQAHLFTQVCESC